MPIVILNIERNKRERIRELCKYFISGKLCLRQGENFNKRY